MLIACFLIFQVALVIVAIIYAECRYRKLAKVAKHQVNWMTSQTLMNVHMEKWLTSLTERCAKSEAEIKKLHEQKLTGFKGVFEALDRKMDKKDFEKFTGDMN